MLYQEQNLFELKYGNVDAWVVTLGSKPYTRVLSDSSSERKNVGNYIQDWNPEIEWIPQKIWLEKENETQKLVRVDRLYHNLVGPIFSERAVKALRPLLEKEGRLLPLETQNSIDGFYLWWVPWVAMSVDSENSIMYRGGRTIKKCSFDYSKIRKLSAFRPHFSGMFNPNGQGDVIVNARLKKEWLDADLTGIHFSEVPVVGSPLDDQHEST